MDVKRLFSKKSWTGEETGKLLIYELIYNYKQSAAGIPRPKPLFTREKLAEMLYSFRDSKTDIEAYNRYVNLQNWIMQYQAVANSYLQRFQSCVNEFISIHNAAESAENEYRYIEQLPRIVTQKQYEELKARRIEETLDPKGDGSDAIGENLFALLVRIIEYYGHELEENPGKPNPLKAIKKRYQKEPIKDKRIIHAYSQAARHLYEDAPGGLSKWDVISFCIDGDKAALGLGVLPCFAMFFPCIEGVYTSPAEFTEQAAAFNAEFPELLKAAQTALDAVGLADEPLSSVPIDKWADIVFSWRELYNADFPGFRKEIESDYNIFDGDKRALLNGVAVLRPSDFLRQPRSASIDEEGHYTEPKENNLYSNLFGLNAYLPDNPESGDNIDRIERTRADLVQSLRFLIGYDTALELIAAEIKLPEFTLFNARSKHSIDRTEALNSLFDVLYTHIAGIDYQDKDRKAAKLQALRDVFYPVDTAALTISGSRKQQAAAMLEGLGAFGEGKSGNSPGWDFLGLLTQEGGGAE